VDRSSFTISEFCQRNGISRGFYYKLKGKGLGPREMSPDGNLIRISVEAEVAWKLAAEVAAAEKTNTAA
jgi:hypothetical protein